MYAMISPEWGCCNSIQTEVRPLKHLVGLLKGSQFRLISTNVNCRSAMRCKLRSRALKPSAAQHPPTSLPNGWSPLCYISASHGFWMKTARYRIIRFWSYIPMPIFLNMWLCQNVTCNTQLCEHQDSLQEKMLNPQFQNGENRTWRASIIQILWQRDPV